MPAPSLSCDPPQGLQLVPSRMTTDPANEKKFNIHESLMYALYVITVTWERAICSPING